MKLNKQRKRGRKIFLFFEMSPFERKEKEKKACGMGWRDPGMNEWTYPPPLKIDSRIFIVLFFKEEDKCWYCSSFGTRYAKINESMWKLKHQAPGWWSDSRWCNFRAILRWLLRTWLIAAAGIHEHKHFPTQTSSFSLAYLLTCTYLALVWEKASCGGFSIKFKARLF